MPNKINNKNSDKFEENESWSIRLGTSVGGKGEVKTEGNITMFGHKYYHQPKTIRIKQSKKLFDHITNNYKNMYGSLKSLDEEYNNSVALKNLQELGQIDLHAPLKDTKGSKTAIYEHTIYIRP